MKYILAAILALAPALAIAQADPVVVNSVRSQLRAISEQMTRYAVLTMDVSGSNSAHVISPKAGVVNRFQCINQAALGGSTATISPSVNGVYMGVVSATITSGTAVGAIVSGTVVTSNTVAEGDALRLQISTGLTGAGRLNCQFVISPTMNYRN